MKKKISLVCIAKDEDLYLQEWVDYHLKLGFESIHIFQNNWRYNGKIKNDNVFFHDYDGKSFDNYSNTNEPLWVKNIQAKCYTEFGKKYYEQYEWTAFFDVDEFLVLKKTDDVKTFIKNYDNYDCLIINWAIFGDNGIKTFDEKNTSQVNRFTRRKKDLHNQFKSICKLKENFEHQIHWINGEWVDTHFLVGNQSFNNNAKDDIAQLNHYYIRTYPEFLMKVERGNACHGKKPMSTFDENNYNEVEDNFAKDFFNRK